MGAECWFRSLIWHWAVSLIEVEYTRSSTKKLFMAQPFTHIGKKALKPWESAGSTSDQLWVVWVPTNASRSSSRCCVCFETSQHCNWVVNLNLYTCSYLNEFWFVAVSVQFNASTACRQPKHKHEHLGEHHQQLGQNDHCLPLYCAITNDHQHHMFMVCGDCMKQYRFDSYSDCNCTKNASDEQNLFYPT